MGEKLSYGIMHFPTNRRCKNSIGRVGPLLNIEDRNVGEDLRNEEDIMSKFRANHLAKQNEDRLRKER